MVVLQRDFCINLVGLAATSTVATAVIGLTAQETLNNLIIGISLHVTFLLRKATALILAQQPESSHPAFDDYPSARSRLLNHRSPEQPNRRGRAATIQA